MACEFLKGSKIPARMNFARLAPGGTRRDDDDDRDDDDNDDDDDDDDDGGDDDDGWDRRVLLKTHKT